MIVFIIKKKRAKHFCAEAVPSFYGNIRPQKRLLRFSVTLRSELVVFELVVS
jgi:hypothetical protein